MSLKAIAFHDKHVAEWLDHTRETLPRVDVLLPTSKPIRDNKSDAEGSGPQYGENLDPFELSVIADVEFDRLPPRRNVLEHSDMTLRYRREYKSKTHSLFDYGASRIVMFSTTYSESA